MTDYAKGCGCDEQKNRELSHVKDDGPQIVDFKITMLIAAGAAMAANCEPCLNKIVPDLRDAGVTAADIRKALEIGQFVKDRPAALMKEAADILTGTHLSEGPVSEECPADELRRAG